jgi:hypothetical protein
MKLSKIKLAIISAGVLASFGSYAAQGDFSTAVGTGSVAGGDATSLTTYLNTSEIDAYVADNPSTSASDGTTGIDSDGFYRYKDGTIISKIESFTPADNTDNTAIGNNGLPPIM